ncbi:hypothetical protein RFI_04582 [Reticulomyxa filosa]|uniref:Uncharacterized protein n=1 Tax=Reticulomyxa filosa TaxID=46433 RepID=X6P376_RETFI|nr:hypothetical protein RFI_04582 [Reticulomyxa filosa]|eukprot:ETO32534.1 hypothetical protein RFI_04582 [Reticulomyxa filosa]
MNIEKWNKFKIQNYIYEKKENDEGTSENEINEDDDEINEEYGDNWKIRFNFAFYINFLFDFFLFNFFLILKKNITTFAEKYIRLVLTQKHEINGNDKDNYVSTTHLHPHLFHSFISPSPAAERKKKHTVKKLWIDMELLRIFNEIQQSHKVAEGNKKRVKALFYVFKTIVLGPYFVKMVFKYFKYYLSDVIRNINKAKRYILIKILFLLKFCAAICFTFMKSFL